MLKTLQQVLISGLLGWNCPFDSLSELAKPITRHKIVAHVRITGIVDQDV